MARKYISIGLVLLVASLLLAACGVPQEEHDTVVAERDAALVQVSSLESDLAAIREVHPPRHFNSATELREWLAADTVSDMPVTEIAETLVDKTLQLQEAALEDGYIISLDIDEETEYFVVNALALIGGLIWIIEVESDEVYQWSTLGAVR